MAGGLHLWRGQSRSQLDGWRQGCSGGLKNKFPWSSWSAHQTGTNLMNLRLRRNGPTSSCVWHARGKMTQWLELLRMAPGKPRTIVWLIGWYSYMLPYRYHPGSSTRTGVQEKSQSRTLQREWPTFWVVFLCDVQGIWVSHCLGSSMVIWRFFLTIMIWIR